jgi:hypothetical protein
MQLDLRQFQLKVEGLTRLRPLPDATKVEVYVKAFYLPETALDDFCREHTVLRVYYLFAIAFIGSIIIFNSGIFPITVDCFGTVCKSSK